MSNKVRVQLLGPVHIEGEALSGELPRSQKGLALLAYLIAQQTAVARSILLALFWPNLPESRGRANLSWVVHGLRKSLPGYLSSTPQYLQWNSEAPAEVDLLRLQKLLQSDSPDALQQAVALYRGEFLEGLYLEDCPAFETWLTGEREHWRQEICRAVETLIKHAVQQGDITQAIQWSTRLLQWEPWREEVHRQVMHWLAHQGQYTAALHHYEQCRQALAEELSLPPSPETQRLYHRICAARDRPPPALPLTPHTSFVGRQQELAEVRSRLLSPECRLLTLTGMGGVGKTRLALQLARQLSLAFLEGVVFVPLQDLSSAELLTSAIAQQINLPVRGERPLEDQLLDFLQTREILLILDGFEVLLNEEAEGPYTPSTAKRLISRILAHAPEVTFLITSREPLNLQEEWVYPLQGLQTHPTAEDLPSAAVQLYLHRARQAGMVPPPSPRTQAHIARICTLLAGLPLAIEITAALSLVQPLESTLAQLEANPLSLQSPLSNMPARHISLEAVCAHSWMLLTPQEQRLFRQLAVFRGGFRPAAVHSVTHTSLTLLNQLVRKSLVQQLPGERLGLHPLLHQFAQQRLAETPHEQNQVQRAHAQYYLAQLQRYGTGLRGPQVQQAARALTTEIENIQQAWQWAIEHHQADMLAQALIPLFDYVNVLCRYQEGAFYFQHAVKTLQEQGGPLSLRIHLTAHLAYCLLRTGRSQAAQEHLNWCLSHLTPSRMPRQAALVYLYLADLYRLHGDNSQALQLTRQARRLFKQLGDRLWEAMTMERLGLVYWEQGKFADAQTYLENSLQMYQSLGYRRGEASVLHNLGSILDLCGQRCQGREYLERSLAISRALGNRLSQGITLNSLGFIALRVGDLNTAKQYLETALQIEHEIGNLRDEIIPLSNLCLLHHYAGEHQLAIDYGRQALALTRRLGDRRYEGYALLRLGHIFQALGQATEAVNHYRQALNTWQTIGHPQLIIEAQAALAAAYLQANKLSQARQVLAPVMSRFHDLPTEGMDDVCQMYLNVYRVLQATGNPHAEEALRRAYECLDTQIEQITTPEERQTCLENVPSHRQLFQMQQTQKKAL